ncbi:MAG: hypothetical protein CVU88_05970 [Firmicutes bacterium HGW-Firmicutes-13]|nr:MAG: hypothetical protein CVU88_05970 [Firmicutes bacterium HGW-Firmicutes-13]
MNLYLPAYKKSDPKNYSAALEYSKKAFASSDPQKMGNKSGASFDKEAGNFVLRSLGHVFSVKYPEGWVKFQGLELEPHFILQIIFINYLARADGIPLTCRFITYRDLPGGEVFYSAFYRTAIKPLAQTFGRDPKRLTVPAAYLGGEVVEDKTRAEVNFWFLPRVPLRYLVWSGDDEIESRANILFDSSAGSYLYTEDLAGAGSYLTDCLTELFKNCLV